MFAVVMLASIVFWELFIVVKANSTAKELLGITKQSLGVIRSESMDDDEKAIAMQKNSLNMLKQVFLCCLKIMAALFGSFVVFYMAHITGGWTLEELALYSVNPIVLIAVVILLVVYGKIRHAVIGKRIQ
ncbi:hypothetical protein [Marinibactrum halimedae]|uniref:Uncharacterized protein n=1 Tax=Marinibactrum halimedae TaxID=1444977 RepID=A0AA37T769_9GAMM|nr:hypothetical protein [Marinibactrum halimedae]MCD9457897.1 hypothetical protein [Marinibactrum halimedae]GLS26278.1 hypothetical protein GCM10007877_19930 [Marinibactrum halimedae]